VVHVREIGPRDEELWRCLCDRASEPNPFMEPDCLIPAAVHQSFGAEIEIAVAEESGSAYACVPLRAVSRWHSFPYPFVTTQVRRSIECGTPLIDAERGAEALGAVLSTLSERRGVKRSRVLAVPKVSQDGPVFEAFQTAAHASGLPFIVYESWDRGLICRRPEPNYEGDFSPDFRANLRRRRRRLADELGVDPIVVDRTGDPAALDRYLDLEASGYKTKSGLAMETEPGEREFFRDMCQRFAASGRLRLLAMEVGDRTLAMLTWIRGGDGLFGFRMSYDEQFARYGPGIMLQIAAIEDFHSNTNADWLDTCTYRDNETLLRLYPDRRPSASIFVPLSKNPMDRAAARSFMALQPAHRFLWDRAPAVVDRIRRSAPSAGTQLAASR
jgi:hypothetical protein